MTLSDDRRCSNDQVVSIRISTGKRYEVNVDERRMNNDT